jgi:hypothetical protein
MQGGGGVTHVGWFFDFVNNRRFQVLLKASESKRATCSGYFKPMNQKWAEFRGERTGGSLEQLFDPFFEKLRTFDYISNPGILNFFLDNCTRL